MGRNMHEFADVEIAKVGLLGTELLVGKPKVIEYFAWVLWLYFFSRYLQQFFGVSDFGVEEEFTDRVVKYAHRYARRTFPDTPYGGLLNKFDLVKVGMFAWELRNIAYNRDAISFDDRYRTALPRHRVIYWAGNSAAGVAFLSPKISDYFLPIVLGLCPPIVAWIY